MFGHIANLMLHALVRTHFETDTELTATALNMCVTDFAPHGDVIIISLKACEKIVIDQNMRFEVQLTSSKSDAVPMFGLFELPPEV